MITARALLVTLTLLTASLLGTNAGKHAYAGVMDLEEISSNLAAHKALYDIKMIAKHSGAQVVNISGKMFYEWKPECDMWSGNHRFELDYEYADVPPMRISSSFSTHETKDGSHFDFISRRKRNGTQFQELLGNAKIEESGKGVAKFTKPEGLFFDLPDNSVFPAQHAINLISHAKQGKRFYHANLFDGNDMDGPIAVNSFIGKKTSALEAKKDNKNIDSSLLENDAWKMRLAFFALGESSEDSKYEMSAVIHDNGVVSDMIVEYHDFTISQELVALEKIKPAGCAE